MDIYICIYIYMYTYIYIQTERERESERERERYIERERGTMHACSRKPVSFLYGLCSKHRLPRACWSPRPPGYR